MGIRDKPIAPASPWQNGFNSTRKDGATPCIGREDFPPRGAMGPKVPMGPQRLSQGHKSKNQKTKNTKCGAGFPCELFYTDTNTI